MNPKRPTPTNSLARWLIMGVVLAPVDPGQSRSPAGVRATSCHAVLEAQLPSADSMVVLEPQTRCGLVRLVLVGGPRRRQGGGFEIPVALENAGTESIELPIAMDVDSVTPVQRGRQLSAFYDRVYVGFAVWDGQETQQPWRFTSLLGGAARLTAGERTAVRLLKLGTAPLTQGFRVWLKIRGAFPKSPDEPVSPTPVSLYPDTAPLPPVVEDLIRTVAFPNLRAKRALYRDPIRRLVIFDVAYGPGHDCPAGCFYSHAVGMALGEKRGWLHLFNYDQSRRSASPVAQRMFRIDSTDTYLLSGELLDSLSRLFGRYGWPFDQVVLPTILGSPHVPRKLLERYVADLYENVDQGKATLLIGLPKVLHDPGLLTLLALLPNGGPPYEGARNKARAALRDRWPALVKNPNAPTRTLFVLAQAVQWPVDSALLSALLRHPRVQSSPAILAILLDSPVIVNPNPDLWSRLVSAVDASRRVKDMLAAYLTHRWYPEYPHDTSLGWRILRDPEAGANRDVLLVLANLVLSNDENTVWTATRRLPEGSLRRWEPDYIAIP